MQLSDNDLDEFIEIYQKEFGKPLSRDGALEIATRLTSLYRIIMRQIPPDKISIQEAKKHPDTSHEGGG